MAPDFESDAVDSQKQCPDRQQQGRDTKPVRVNAECPAIVTQLIGADAVIAGAVKCCRCQRHDDGYEDHWMLSMLQRAAKIRTTQGAEFAAAGDAPQARIAP